MQNVVKWFITAINDIVLSIAGKESTLIKPMDTLNKTVFGFVQNVMNNVTMPIAYTVLALFFMLELYKASLKIENNGGGTTLGAEMIFRVLVKMTICKMVLDYTPDILTVVYNVTVEITSGIKNIISTPTGKAAVLDVASMETALSALTFWDFIPLLILGLIVFLIIGIAWLLANIIIVTRFIEIYLYFAVSPIPLATLTHDEMSQIGKNFLKSFVAVCLQGSLIFLVMSFFPYLIGDTFFELDSGSIGEHFSLYLAMLGAAGYGIVLILAIFSTQKLAKSICNAM